jgi:predicted kinase
MPPRLIVMAGLAGTGKSTLARELARRLHVPVFSVDPIESAIVEAGIARSFETGLAAYLVARALADAQLAAGGDAIIDAVNAEEEGKDVWRTLARAHGLAPHIIECRCSDEALHRMRLAERRRGLAIPEPSWDDVQQRSQAYTTWTEPLLAVDAAASLEANAARALAWLSYRDQLR